jgi:hypothetical protein
MNRQELIKKLMSVAENYKEGYLYGTGAITDIGVLVDEYTETVVKNCSIPDVVGRSEQLVCDCGRDEINKLSGICEICWNEKFPDEAN